MLKNTLLSPPHPLPVPLFTVWDNTLTLLPVVVWRLAVTRLDTQLLSERVPNDPPLLGPLGILGGKTCEQMCYSSFHAQGTTQTPEPDHQHQNFSR